MSRNPIVFGGAVLLAAAVILMGFVFPRGRQVDAARESLIAERASLEELQSHLQDLKAADPVELQSSAARYRGLVPGSVDLEQLLALLDRLASESGVAINSVSVGAPGVAANAAVSSVALNLSVRGEYFSLARFLFALENAPRLIRARTISLTGGTGELQMGISVETYTTDQNTGPGSDPEPGVEVGS